MSFEFIGIISALSLFMFFNFTNYPHASFAPDNFALLTKFLN